jgi:hypothetical protein
MSQRLKIPKGASLSAFSSGPVTAGPHQGAKVLLKLWTGYASHGWKSGFEAKPSAWLEVTITACPHCRGERHAWSYSGKRYPKALQDYNSNRIGMAELSELTEHTAPKINGTEAMRP